MKFLSIEDMLTLDKPSGNTNYKDMEVDLKVGDDRPQVTKIIRLIGFAVPIERFSPFKKDGNGERKDAKFPDRENNTEGYKENKKFYRMGTQDDPEYGECPWKRGGWECSHRLGQNCLERHKDGTFSVKILTGPRMLFDEFTKIQKLNNQRNEELVEAGGKPKYPVHFGGITSYDFRIIAELDASKKKMKMPKYNVSPEPELIKITDEEIAALEAVGKPTDEELEAIYSANEFLRKGPAWMLYGYNLKRYFKPDLLIREGESAEAPPRRTAVSVTEVEAPKAPAVVEEWEEPAVVEAPKAPKPAAKPPKPAEAVAEVEAPAGEDNVFTEDDEDLGF